MADADPFAATPVWARPWTQLWGAMTPPGLSQPVLPGWSFGDVTVNEQNSSDPGAEQAIVASQSYGRQIGKLLDAVCARIEAEGGPKGVKVYEDVIALQKKVEAIKTDAAARRIDQFRHDLELLRTADPKAFAEKVKALSALLPSPG